MSDRAAIDRLLSDATAKGEIAGVVAAAGSAGGEIYAGAAGRRDLAKPDPMTVDTVFWIASMTKAIVSAAAMQLVEQGKVGLDQDLGGILPALASPSVLEGWDDGKPRLRPAKGAITLRHLLTHTAGFSYEIWNADIARYQEHAGIPSITTCENKALTTPLIADPGTQWNYGINIDFAGKLVEALSGQRLDAYLQDHIFAPLGMRDTGFKLRPDQRTRLAAMHARSPDDGKLTPIPFEMPQEPEFHMGGGGLYSTAGDYLAFCRMILNRGTLDGATVLRPETVKLMGQNHMGDINVTKLATVASASSFDAEFFPGMVKKWGLGFMISTAAVPSRRAANSLTWAGLGNTYFWIDPASDVAGVIMTQSLPFADPAVLGLYEAFETEVYRGIATQRAA
jgi:CubicO group peptidase (beta-lactamase class C family)